MATLKASTEQIRAYNRQRKEAMRAMAAAAAAEPRRAPGMETTPTRERIAKGVALHPVYNAQGFQEARVYRTKGPVEQYAETWPHDCYSAFRVYVLDAHSADGPSLVVDLNRSGGGGSRLGGLGNVHQKVRDAYERYEWVRARLTPGSIRILDWLVLEVKREADGRGLTMEEVGRTMFPAFKDKATNKGIAIGRLLGAGEELAVIYNRYRILSREPQAERPMKVVGGNE